MCISTGASCCNGARFFFSPRRRSYILSHIGKCERERRRQILVFLLCGSDGCAMEEVYRFFLCSMISDNTAHSFPPHVVQSGQLQTEQFSCDCEKKKNTCAQDHTAEEKPFWRNVRTNSTLSSIKFFKSPSDHNL